MKVYLIDNANNGQRYNRQWLEHIPQQIASWGYEVEVITVQVSSAIDPSVRANLLSAKLLEKLLHLINYGALDNAILLFPEARDYAALPLYDLISQKKLNVKTWGFWTDGIYYTHGDLRKKLHKDFYQIHSAFERSLVRAFDRNLVIDNMQYEYFVKVYTRKRDDDIRRCSYPFSYLLDLKPEIYNKEDIILFNSSPSSNQNLKILEIIKKDLEDYNFIDVYTEEFSEEEYHRILQRSKAIINTNESETSPYSIFEALIFGVLPIMPELELYKEMFEGHALYDPDILTPPYIKFTRNRHTIYDKVKEYVDNYENYVPLIEDSINFLHDNYYNSNDLKKLLANEFQSEN